MVSRPSHYRMLYAIVAAASVCASAAADEPRHAAPRPRVRTLELRVGRDKQIVPSAPEQKQQVEQFYRSLEEQAKQCVVPFQRHLEHQARFIGKVCEFDDRRQAALGEQCQTIAQAALDRLCEAIFARRNYGNVGITVDGVEVRVPAGADELFLRSPREAARQELDQALAGELSAAARGQLDAERQQAAVQAREADVLLQVALLDEALLLDANQRDSFRDLLTQKWTDAWRPPDTVELFFGAKRARPSAAKAGIGGPFQIPEVELSARLRPAQAALLLESRNRGVARINGPNSTNGAFAGAAASPIDDQLLALVVDDTAATCDLSDEQRTKLQLAGELAMKRQRAAAAAEPREGMAAGQLYNSPAAVLASFMMLLGDEHCPYFKALGSMLTPAKRLRLNEADAQRRQFHERAMLAHVVRELSDRAVLTAAQRGRLSEFVIGRLADAPDADRALGPRLGQLHRIVTIRPIALEVAPNFRAIFDDFQWPLACDAWKSVERDLTSQEFARIVPPGAVQERAAGKGMF